MNKTIKLKGTTLEYTYPDEYILEKDSIKEFLKSIKKINKLNFDKADYFYSDNFWDFSPYTTLNVRKIKLCFNFDLCCETFRNDLKDFIFIEILQNKRKIQSTHTYFSELYDFFNFIESKGFYHIKDITDNIIKEFLSIREKVSIYELRNNKKVLKEFFIFQEINFKILLTNERLSLLENTDISVYYACAEQSKTPNIPEDYFNKFLSATLKIIDNKEEEMFHRGVACIYVILSQTGLRIGECLDLEVGCLKEISIFNGEKKAYYIDYKTWKREKGNNVYTWEKTYVNELTKKAYDNLIDIYKEKREKLKSNYLFLGNHDNEIPLNSDRFDDLSRKYFLYLNQFFPTINVPKGTYKNIPTLSMEKRHFSKKKYPNTKTVTRPNTLQFRVHVCTELYNKGVPLKYIEKFMSHLSSDMAGYYVRPNKKNPQEDMDFSLKTLEKIVSGENKILGSDSGLIEKINEFIEKNHYNVEKDLKTICEKLATKIPIRQKTGGVCIKSSMLRECSKDAKTNEFYCAYGVCKNIFHFYYMADVSYRQAKELCETITINKERGHMRQVQKELNMLYTITKNKLIPELDELKNMINKKDINSILMEYPDLKEIVENYDSIYEEALKWKEQIL